MPNDFDTIVIGSGFGGAVSACRLAEKGHRVLVLERGKRWAVEDYPRQPGDEWVYDPERPEREHGWIDMRVFDDMIVVQGAGVGGGSLIYANISVEAPPAIFEQGWPPEITFAELKPYYDRVAEMLDVQLLPDGPGGRQLTERFKIVREAAQALGFEDRFRKIPMAVTFDEEWSYDLDDPFDPSHSKQFVNAHGQEQGTCVHLGNCDIGCDVKAKNTLDLNYLPRAESHGAVIRPLHLVRRIEPVSGGYRVAFEEIRDGDLVPGSHTAERVVVAAGSLGSTELLLRCRDQFKTLPDISPFLGRAWSSNGDFLTPAFHDRPVNPTEGPTITGAIDFADGSFRGQEFWVQDGGFPNVVDNYLEAKLDGGTGDARFRLFLEGLRAVADENQLTANVMPWFSQGKDAADGRLRLARKWWAPWRRELELDWDVKASEPAIEAIIAMHETMAEATGGDPWVPPTWTLLKNLITPHPLGGCNMGTSPSNGVVDHRGEVFGYPGLYVADGAIVPEAIGRNPSRTIAALAERIADLMD